MIKKKAASRIRLQRFCKNASFTFRIAASHVTALKYQHHIVTEQFCTLQLARDIAVDGFRAPATAWTFCPLPFYMCMQCQTPASL